MISVPNRTDVAPVSRTIAAFDPGPRWTGFACVTMHGGAGRPVRFVYREGRKMESTPEQINWCFALGVDLVAVESVDGVPYEDVRAAKLMETNGVARAIEWLALGRGLPVERLSARAWRSPLCGRGNASDDQIARVVALHIRELPRRTNVHVRDALGLAVVAGWRFLQRREARAAGTGAARGRAKGAIR
ncbi:hypothetical protein LZC95_19425 [Pendulispora brunnea]|uniref:Holliday junction resolvase RuvC n=1 Tax=Pendulispora brunnea TaxID=2905690 RepID=A0ABZ2KNR5_9BACT